MRTLIVATACAAVLALSGVSQAAQISTADDFRHRQAGQGPLPRPQWRDQPARRDGEAHQRIRWDGGDV